MKMNKTRIAVLTGLVMTASAMLSFDILDDTGKAGRTGSPGETTCTGCHTGFALNDGTGSVTISSPDLATWEYMPGDTYIINVTVARTGSPLFGFDLECLTGSTPAQNAGTLIVTNTAETHILNATVSTVVRKNMTHKLNAGLGTDTKTFSFKWAAPTTNVGNVTFYCAGNATNMNGAKTGDHIYTTTQVVTPAIGAATNEIEMTKSDFNVFPNPTSGNLFVTYSTPLGEHVDFTLMTLEGKVAGPVYTFQGTGSSTTSAIVLPEGFASGVYLLRMQNGDVTSMKKVVVR
jgi:hypothetical protein